MAQIARQKRLCGKKGRVWQSRIIPCITTTLEAKITKVGGKRMERTVAYDTNKDALRWEFGRKMELDELEMAGGRAH